MKKINLISLALAFNRREAMINQISELGWEYNLVEAVSKFDPEELNQFEWNDPLFADLWKREVRKGEIACYFSHLKTLEWILSSEDDYGIVCEDDVKLYGGPIRLEAELEFIDEPWDMLYLAEHIIPALTKYDGSSGVNWRGIKTAPVGTQFYAISIRLAEHILENYQMMAMPIDELYRNISMNRSLDFRFLTLKRRSALGRHWEDINQSLIAPVSVN